MRNKLGWSLAGVVIFSLLVIACGGGGGGDSVDTNTPLPSSNALPPDPVDAGKATLSGTDSDNDGLRDDVQRAISTLEYSGEALGSVTQLAMGIQSAITHDGSSASAREAGEQLAKATDCASHVFGLGATDEILVLELLALNTEARADAYEEFNVQSAGQQYGEMASKEVACE